MSAKRGGKGTPSAPEDAVGGSEPEGELSLEQRLERLEGIVATLEGGDVELEKGLALFEEGVGHIRAAEALLSRAELRVEELVGEAESLDVRRLEDEDEG